MGVKAPASAIQSKKSRTHGRVENSGLHESVTEILRLSGQSFERPAPWRLLALVGNHRRHGNAVMRANHPIGKNTLLHQIKEIRPRHLKYVGRILSTDLHVGGEDVDRVSLRDEPGSLLERRDDRTRDDDLLALDRQEKV